MAAESCLRLHLASLTEQQSGMNEDARRHPHWNGYIKRGMKRHLFGGRVTTMEGAAGIKSAEPCGIQSPKASASWGHQQSAIVRSRRNISGTSTG